jgi:HPt (histidine-containing phosphotransfer) domain-containing protein
MAALFAELAPQHLALARAAAASGDHDALARAAHALRGSCGQMGAAAAAQLCREAELAGPTAPVPELLRLVARIEREVATHQAWLARELAAGAALP